MRGTKGRVRLLGAVFAIGIFAAACSSAGASAGSGGISLSIASPSDGATVSEPFTVKLDASVPIGDPSTGDHHVHLCFDGGSCDDVAGSVIAYTNTARVDRALAGDAHDRGVAAQRRPLRRGREHPDHRHRERRQRWLGRRVRLRRRHDDRHHRPRVSATEPLTRHPRARPLAARERRADHARAPVDGLVAAGGRGGQAEPPSPARSAWPTSACTCGRDGSSRSSRSWRLPRDGGAHGRSARETFRRDRGDARWWARWPFGALTGRFARRRGHVRSRPARGERRDRRRAPRPRGGPESHSPCCTVVRSSRCSRRSTSGPRSL